MLQKLRYRGIPECPWALEFTLLPRLSSASNDLNSYFVLHANDDNVTLRPADITPNPLIQQYMAEYEFLISEHGFENGIWVSKITNTPSAEVHLLKNATDDDYDGSEWLTYTSSFQIVTENFENDSITLLFTGAHKIAHAVYKVSVIRVNNNDGPDDDDDQGGDDQGDDDQGGDDQGDYDQGGDDQGDDKDDDEDDEEDYEEDEKQDDAPRASTSTNEPPSGWRTKKRNLPKTFVPCPKNNGWCSKEKGHKYRCNSHYKPQYPSDDDDDWLI